MAVTAGTLVFVSVEYTRTGRYGTRHQTESHSNTALSRAIPTGRPTDTRCDGRPESTAVSGGKHS
jgi:hypothetical protein